MTDRDLNHPIWHLYDKFRTTALNERYYRARLESHRSWNTLIQMIIAVTAPGSAIAKFRIFQFGLGELSWQILSMIAATFGLLLPVLRLTTKVQKLEKLYLAYQTRFYDLEKIIRDVHHDGCYESEHQSALEAALGRTKHILELEKDFSENSKLKRTCTEAVRKRFPARDFFIPKAKDVNSERL